MNRLILSLTLAALLSVPAFAYDINDLLRDARAYHSQFQQEVGDMTLEMTATFTAEEAGASSMKSVHYRKGEKWRMETDMNMDATAGNANGSLSTVMLFDGENYWSTMMGMKTKLSKEQMQGDGEKGSFWHEPPEGSKIVGEESVSGRDCWIVEYPANPMMKSAPKYWIDKSRFVFVQSESELSGKKMRGVFSDYRKVKGDYEIPYHTDLYSDDAKTMTADVTKLEIGTGLSDDLFNADLLGGGGAPGMPDMQNIDMEQLMKQAEEMQKKAEEMQKKMQEQQQQQQGGN